MKQYALLALTAMTLSTSVQAIDIGDVLNTVNRLGNMQSGGVSGSNFSGGGGMPQYPYQLPAINIANDNELEAMVNDASSLLTKVGTTLACSSNPGDYLEGYASPQHGNFFVGNIWHQNHQQGTCYQIINVSATKQARNAFIANYAFLSPSSGESDRKQVGLIKLNGTWYLKNAY